MTGEFHIVASDCIAVGQFLGLERVTVRGQDELGFGFGRFGAQAQSSQRFADLAGLGHSQMDIAALQHAARHVGFVRVAFAQAGDRRFLVAESGEESEREFGGIKRCLGQLGDGGFDLDCVHGCGGWDI